MKKIFSLIAIFIVAALLFAAAGLATQLYNITAAPYVLYGLSAVFFCAAVITAIKGYNDSRKNK